MTPIEFKYKVENLTGTYVWTAWGFTPGNATFATKKTLITGSTMFVRMVVPTKYAGSLIFFKVCYDPVIGIVVCGDEMSFDLPSPTEPMPYHCHTYNDICS